MARAVISITERADGGGEIVVAPKPSRFAESMPGEREQKIFSRPCRSISAINEVVSVAFPGLVGRRRHRGIVSKGTGEKLLGTHLEECSRSCRGGPGTGIARAVPRISIVGLSVSTTAPPH